MIPVIFEDSYHDNFYPLSLTRPLWDLRAGLYTFRERFESVLAGCGMAEGHFLTREYLAVPYRERYPSLRVNDPSLAEAGGEFLFLNALLRADGSIADLGEGRAIADGRRLVAARVKLDRLELPFDPVAILRIPGLEIAPPGPPVAGGFANPARHIWDLVDWNGAYITLDHGTGERDKPENVTIIGDPGQVYCEKGVVIEPMVVMDATDGPIVIGSGTHIQSFSRIEGPAAIGRNCMVLGAKIRGGCSFGDFCRIGGEVEASVFQGYTNKYHEGFIGHSYIGEWINMGALTTNSDLKNDYSQVKVYLPDSRRKTGLMKVGCFMGDFARTSIGSLINTGTVVGTGAMLIQGSRLTPPHVPPFCWFIDGEVSRVDWIDEFFVSCEQAMSRRGVAFTSAWKDLLGDLYIMTAPSCPLR